MRKLSHREKNIAIFCMGVIFIFLVFHYFMEPLKERAVRIKRHIKEAQHQLEKNSRIIEKNKDLSKKGSAYLDRMSQKGSDEEILAGINATIESVAAKTKVRFFELKPNKVKKIDFYNVFSASLSLEGNLLEIAEFLYMLENLPYLFDVEELHLEKNFVPGSAGLKASLILSKILIPEPVFLNRHQTEEKNIEEFSLAQRRPFSDYAAQISKRDIFQMVLPEVPQESSSQEAIEEKPSPMDPPQLRLIKNLKLLGVVLDQEPEAILLDPQTNETVFLFQGDRFQDAVVENIEADKVILNYKGQRVEIFLY